MGMNRRQTQQATTQEGNAHELKSTTEKTARRAMKKKEKCVEQTN